MASPKQIAANRRNAQRSTGPITTEGKAAARYNALDSGIYADREVVLPTEDPRALVKLTGEYHQRFNPRTPEQRCLVDSLVSDEWLLRRFRRIEGEMMTRSCQDVEGKSMERFCLADAWDDNCRSLERLQRRINATHKSFLKNLQALNDLQAAEQALRETTASLPAAASTEENQPLPPSIGFVPSILSEPLPQAPESFGPPSQPGWTAPYMGS